MTVGGNVLCAAWDHPRNKLWYQLGYSKDVLQALFLMPRIKYAVDNLGNPAFLFFFLCRNFVLDKREVEMVDIKQNRLSLQQSCLSLLFSLHF